MFIFITLIDQIVKQIVENTKCEIHIFKDIFNLIYVQNTGALYGTLKGANIMLALFASIVVAFLIIYAYKNKDKNKSRFIILQFIIAGGLSNLIDRIFRGYVVDFIQLKFFGIFNIADALIVFGTISIVFMELKGSLNGKERITDKWKRRWT